MPPGGIKHVQLAPIFGRDHKVAGGESRQCGRDFSHATIKRVGNKYAAVRTRRHSARFTECRLRGRAAVARKGGDSFAGNGRDNPFGSDKTDPKVPGVSADAGSSARVLKRKVAIARFTNETKYGSGLFTDANYDRLGKQAADVLASELTKSGKFIVLERTDLSKLQTESQLMGMTSEEFRKNLVGYGKRNSCLLQRLCYLLFVGRVGK